MNLKDAWPLTKATFSEYSEDKVPRLSAALAYYTMLSIGPLLIICLKIVGLVAGEEAAKGQIRTYLGQLGLGQAGEAVETIIQEGSRPGAGTIATLISLVVLFFSASGVFGELQDSLDTIWEVKPKPDRSWLDMIKERFFSFTLVLGVAFLLLVSLITSAVLAAVAGALSNAIPGGAVVGQVVNFVVSIAVITGLFALIFKYLPDVDLSWRDVLPGALVTAILFTIGKSLLGWYLARGSTTSVYGAFGSLVALLIWTYYSSQILFLGAEFTQVYAQRRGRAVEPSENAEKVTEADRAQQGLRRRPESASPAARIGTIRGNRLATARPVPFALQRATDADDRNQRSRYTSWVMLAVGAVAGRWLMPKKQKRATLTGEQLRVRVATRLRELGVDPGDPRTLDPRRVADQLLPGKSILSEPWWLRAARKLNQKVHATARAVHHEPTMSEQMRHTYERSKKQARREAEEFLHI